MTAKPEYPGDRMMAALRMPGLTATERNVLAVIAWHDGPGGAKLSIELIGLEAGGMAESTARNHIAALVSKGVLKTQKRQRASRYIVNYAAAGTPPKIERPPEPDAPQFEFPDLPDSGKSDRRESRRSKSAHQNPDRSVSKRSQSERVNPDRSESGHSDRSESGRQTARNPDARPLGFQAVNRKEPESNRKDEPGPPVVPPSANPPALKGEGGEIAAAFTAWNELARAKGLAEATMPSASYPQRDRVAALQARLGECGGLDGWQAALDRVAASRLVGDMGSGWRISLDWLLKPERFREVIEGAWERRPIRPAESNMDRAMQILNDREREENAE